MIEICNVSKSYNSKERKRENKLVLKDIDLSIGDGEFCCILGRSGCGKTTLLNILAKSIKDYEGEIYINRKPLRDTQERMVMVFQEPALFPWLTVGQNIEFALRLTGRKDRQASVEKYLQLVGLKNSKNSYIHELSGGMKQRAALGRAIAMESNILLMDEPFAALDQLTKQHLHEELINIWRKEQKTVLFVTHDIEEAILLGDSIAIMGAMPGRINGLVKIEKERKNRKDAGFLYNMKKEIEGMMKQ